MTQVFLRSIGCLACFFAAASAHQSAEDAEAESAPVSVVLLQREPRALSQQQITDAVTNAWPSDFAKGVVFDRTDLASGKKSDPGFVFRTKNWQFLVMSSPRPYVEASDIEQVTDLRSRNMLSEHRASISVSLAPRSNVKDEAIPATILPMMIKLAAELTDANIVGVILPSEEILLPRSEKLQALMREKDPVAALRTAAGMTVLSSSDNDPHMKAAVTEARKTWPEFVKAFENKPENSESFAVRFPFKSGTEQEFMWVEVISISKDSIRGKLANEPVWSKDLKLGDEVTRKVSELTDWLYLNNGQIVGGFTVKVLTKQPDESEK